MAHLASPARATTTRVLRVHPIPVERVWGGRRLATELGRSLPAGKRIGESWEVADVGDVSSVVAAGEHAGRSLRAILGRGRPFPLLVKWIDAREDLSLQVHPDDRIAHVHHGSRCGKSEAWVVLRADRGARLVLGLRRGVTRRALEAACRAGRPEPLLREVRVRAGDVVYSPAGTVHAIGGGLLLLEVQQPSDTTYRLHDWGRVGLDGKPRTLHIEHGTRAVRLSPRRAGIVGRVDAGPRNRLRRILSSRAFSLDVARVRGRIDAAPPTAVEVWVVLGGEGIVSAGGDPGERVERGGCCIVLGGIGRIAWQSVGRADLNLLRARPARRAARGG
ncbi:MAG: class I mannose-6-phosphate isomerase [Planctomycetes bacterium]|nr:class I mannose-6-phosphate isomerase [Planctomycetota bacterium]